MLLLLVLSACAGAGLSFDIYKEFYGETHKIILPRKAESIDFLPEYDAGKITLWNRDDPQTVEDSRRKVVGSDYVIMNTTQEDNGRYVIKDKDGTALVWHILEVKAKKKKYSKKRGESVLMSSVLEGINCNIYFYPVNRTELIAYRGRPQNLSVCTGLTYKKPCEVSNAALEKSCEGRFEFRDQLDNRALVAYLKIEPLFYEKPSFGAGVAVAVLSVLGGCVKVCCCDKRTSKKKKTASPTADEDPEAHNELSVFNDEGHHEPTGPNHEPSGTLYPALPSDPLNHNEPLGPSGEPLSEPFGTLYSAQPSVPLVPPEPPTYSEVITSDGTPLFPLNTGPEQRFEMKGMTFDSGPPLSFDAAEPSVYTSAKLNFL
ncbi:uncharacterized protein LOC114442672 [Parambassis ranga]|uniref:Uncharacterized protein LOC114442672 n=1 Tax=Parambassis ranga TaxID=210632 RepID=A0A6P7J6K8_9TELE|nr:uncharacterized protein LOC114442672 [Parambassis ranga]